MPSLLSKISMFPNSVFWRIDRQYELNNTCGGIATIFFVIILIVISVLQLVQVFKMQTIIATSSSAISLEPTMMNVSTSQNNPMYQPYMLALGMYQDVYWNSSKSANAYYVVMQGGINSPNLTIKTSNITLQNCTAQHFSVIPNISAKAAQWGISNWLCLPLNQTYQIGGSYQLSTLYKRIQVNVTCDKAQNFEDCGYVKLYTLNTAINPTSPTNPSSYYLSQDTFLVKGQAYYDYSSKLNLNTLSVDSSLLPIASLTNTTSIECSQIVLQDQTGLSPQSMTVLKIQASGKSALFNRSYTKLLTAVSYIGGMVSSILAVFFFMAGFNRYFFELRFAREYFNTKEIRQITKQNNFISYFKQKLNKTLSGSKCQIEWRNKYNLIKCQQITETVNKLLDVIHLNKRIAFLQKSLSFLFEKHQLRALYLIHSYKQQEVNDNFENHQLRDKMIYYLYRKKKNIFQNGGFNRQTPDKVEQNRSNTKIQKQQAQGYAGLGSNNDLAKQSAVDDKLEYKNMRLVDEKNDVSNNKSTVKIINEALTRNKQIITYSELVLKEQAELIGQLQINRQGELKIQQELHISFRKLFEEANNNGGDQISKRIYQKLDGWLKTELEEAIEEDRLREGQNLAFIQRGLDIIPRE